MILTTKEYFKKYHFEEYLLHEKYSDWSKCHLNRNKIYRWIAKAKKNDFSEEFRKEIELRKNTPVKIIKLDHKTDRWGFLPLQ